MTMTNWTEYTPEIVHVCGELTAAHVHVTLPDGETAVAVTRIAKRGSLELWAVTPPQDKNLDKPPAYIPNVFWLVRVCKHNGQTTASIHKVAFIYHDNYRPLHELIQPLRTLARLP